MCSTDAVHSEWEWKKVRFTEQKPLQVRYNKEYALQVKHRAMETFHTYVEVSKYQCSPLPHPPPTPPQTIINIQITREHKWILY